MFKNSPRGFPIPLCSEPNVMLGSPSDPQFSCGHSCHEKLVLFYVSRIEAKCGCDRRDLSP
jgi:hypothetical protein